ncbi:MAG: 1-deoxy-D-xylulose-5-phosphate reductoisomerase [FCB group bacterium]|nr:1-deoxy-D-xylulose-5-phosphate reductoisomerase [FCB group bacterium]
MTIPEPAGLHEPVPVGTEPAVRRITILGSTGSIGRSTLAVVRHYPNRFKVVGLGAGANIELLAQQVAEFKPEHVAVASEDAAEKLRGLIPGIRVRSGETGLQELAAEPADIVLCAIVGAAGLRPLLSAIDAGNGIAVANKEPLVMAGELVMRRAWAKGLQVLPVDSEHNAIFQCIHGHRLEDVQCIHLTASGGPFYKRDRETLRAVTPEQAAKHPTWDMGTKISVDSATLMNKGLEVIEAMWLFGLPLDRIQVVIHPQSIVHSLVEFNDGSILAHLGITDMRFPILFALTWPERVESPMGRLDLTKMRELTFAAPDFSDFPCLAHAFHAARTGGTCPAILNAANEVAVDAFCRRQISFLEISDVVGSVLELSEVRSDAGLESVLEADRAARACALQLINRMSP